MARSVVIPYRSNERALHQLNNPTCNICNTRMHTATPTNPSTTLLQLTADSPNAGNAGGNSEGKKSKHVQSYINNPHYTVRDYNKYYFVVDISISSRPQDFYPRSLTRRLINTSATLAALETNYAKCLLVKENVIALQQNARRLYQLEKHGFYCYLPLEWC